MTPAERAALRAHAETATPGPWDAGKYGIAGGEDFTTPVVSWDYAWADCANEEWDKPFIAAANPTAVLSLLDDVEQIERQTQRRMIAALYWRAGTLDALGYAVPAVHVAGAARAMEAAL